MTQTTLDEPTTTPPREDWRTRLRASAHRSRVKVAAMAAALFLLGGAGGFVVGHTTAGDAGPGRPGSGQRGPGGTQGGPPGSSQQGSTQQGTTGSSSSGTA